MPWRRFYAGLAVGRFEGGLPTVAWNGVFERENRTRFLYRPDPAAPFAFRSPSLGRAVVPGAMDTDGGSTPPLLRAFPSLSPWRFGPTAIVHDWFYAARRCGVAPDKDVTFEEAARVAAETMKTLMEVGFEDADGRTKRLRRNALLTYLVYRANTSKAARRIWDDDTRERECRG